jgi:hypothetical protein
MDAATSIERRLTAIYSAKLSCRASTGAHFPTGLSLGDLVPIFAAAEAGIGLLIEIIFLAAFTQRFFAR